MTSSLIYRGTLTDGSEGMVLVLAAEGESQDKLRSLPNALHNSGCRFNFWDGEPLLNGYRGFVV